MSEDTTNEMYRSRRAVLSTVGAATGTSLFAGNSSAESVTGNGRDFLEILEDIKHRHGELTRADGEDRGDVQVMSLTFGGDYDVRFRLNRVSQRRARVHYDGDTYLFKRENFSYNPTPSRKPEVFGLSDTTTSGVGASDISAGDTRSVSSAEDYKYKGYGGSIGSKWVDHDLSEFEAECAIQAYALGYRAQVTDVYSDVSVDSSVDKLELDYNYDYKWGGSAFGAASTTVEGEVIVRDLDKGKNLTTSEMFENSGAWAEYRSGSETGSAATVAETNGSGNYRVGIRAYTEIEASGPGLCTASISRSGENNHYFDIDNLQVSGR